jgi:hypothetical protein
VPICCREVERKCVRARSFEGVLASSGSVVMRGVLRGLVGVRVIERPLVLDETRPSRGRPEEFYPSSSRPELHSASHVPCLGHEAK